MFIKQMQSNHRLPLAQIKLILEQRDKGREVTALIEMKEVVFGQCDPERLDKKTFCKVTGLSREEIEKCLAENLPIPSRPW